MGMAFIDDQLILFKQRIEEAIVSKGSEGKTSVIRSSGLIQLIHDAIKYELILQGISPNNIFPKLYETKPEINLAGFFKQKKQDICVVPSNIKKVKRIIDWGPLGYLNRIDQYGAEYSQNTLVINVRSQMSSLGKNTDTLFERTFAESYNLHIEYPGIVLGEVFLIPVNEYDADAVKKKKVAFSERLTNLELYITFFNAINNRSDVESDDDTNDFRYERCALMIVDFNRKEPFLYNSTDELVRDNLIRKDFPIEIAELSFKTFAENLIRVYASRHNIENLN